MTSFSILSVAEYIKVADLTGLVNASVNACAAARPHPSLVPSFLAQHFHQLHFESPAAVAIQSAELGLCGYDGNGTPQLAVTLRLADGRCGSAVVAHSCGLASLHPSTSRINRRVGDARMRAARANSVYDLAGMPQLMVSLEQLQQQQQQQQQEKPTGGKTSSANNSRPQSSVSGSPTSPLAPAAATSGSPASPTTGATIRKVLSNAVSSRALSAAKPLRDFDGVLSSVDGSSNFAVLGANIAAAASIAFAKLRAQIQRTPLGLSQPLYRLIASDFPEGGAAAAAPSSTSSTSSSSSRTWNCPIPLVPLFGSDPPVFGKLRLLRSVVVYPSPAWFANDKSSGGNAVATLAAALHNVQQVAVAAFEKLTSDEATQQPPILLPHCGGIIKHVALESVPAVLEFAEECIKEARLVPGQDVMVGLVLDGALCSPRAGPGGDMQDDFFGTGTGAGGAAGGKGDKKSGASPGRGGSRGNTRSAAQQQQQQQQAAAAESALAATAAEGGVPAIAPKYVVLEGGAEWTGAQLADHIAMAQAAKPDVFGFVQDCLREDDVNEMRRLMARVGKTMAVAGDEVFCSAQQVVERLATETVANTMVIRVNDAGTLSAAVTAARTFQAVVPGGSLCVSAEACDGEAVAAVDLAVSLGARYLHVGGVTAGAGCNGSAMLSRLLQIAAEVSSAGEKLGFAAAVGPSEAYSRIQLPPEPAEPLGQLEVPTGKETKRGRR